MILTEEQRGTAAFDLEKACGAVEMALHGDESVVDRGFWAAISAEILADAITEIERLRNDLQDCGSYVGIGPGEGDLPIPERVRRCVNRLKETQNHYSQKLIAKDAEIERLRGEMENYGDDYVCQMKSKDARIQELEDALAEYQRLGKIMEGRLPCLTLHGECERCSSRAKELCDAMHQIAEGKIGPEDAKPRSWQITDERILAIENAISSCVLIERYTGQDLRQETTALRSMLKEAGQ